MAGWTTQLGNNMPVIGQASMMECWITCYQMILKANGINWTIQQIENKLVSGGFDKAKQARITGIGDEDLLPCANALKMGYNKTSSIDTLSGVKNMLKMCGPLWVAGQFPDEQNRYHRHVIVIIGVDEETKQVCIVNPWLQHMFDIPSKGWINYSQIKKSIKPTLHTDGSLQYLTPIHAIVLALSA